MDDRATNKDGQAIVVNTAPDVCLTPMGGQMVPVPYNITSKFDIAIMVSTNVNYTGLPAFTMASRLPTVTGDEPGVGGGVKSGVNLGFCRPIQHAETYRVNGQWVVRNSDDMDMNCAGPTGPGNTVGKIIYAGTGPVDQLPEDEDEDDDVNPEDDPEYKKLQEEIAKAEKELEQAKWEIAQLAIETGLDVAGIFDPTPASDTAAMAMAWNRGDYWGMFGNALGYVPYLGDAVGKPLKAWRSSAAATRLAEKVQAITKALAKLKENLKKFADAAKARIKAKMKGKPNDPKKGGHMPGPVPQKAKDTLDYIKKNGTAPPGYKGGKTFKNDGRDGGQVLPKTDAKGNPIEYKEWDVNPYTKGVNRGPERIVTGSDGSAYFTGNHYGTFTPM